MVGGLLLFEFCLIIVFVWVRREVIIADIVTTVIVNVEQRLLSDMDGVHHDEIFKWIY